MRQYSGDRFVQFPDAPSLDALISFSGELSMSARQVQKKQAVRSSIESVLKGIDEELARLRAARDLLLEDTHRALVRAQRKRPKVESKASSRGRNGHLAHAVAKAS